MHCSLDTNILTKPQPIQLSEHALVGFLRPTGRAQWAQLEQELESADKEVIISAARLTRAAFLHMIPFLKNATILPSDFNRTIRVIPLGDLNLVEQEPAASHEGPTPSESVRDKKIRALSLSVSAWRFVAPRDLSLAEFKLLFPSNREGVERLQDFFIDSSRQVLEDSYDYVFKGNIPLNPRRYYSALQIVQPFQGDEVAFETINQSLRSIHELSHIGRRTFNGHNPFGLEEELHALIVYNLWQYESVTRRMLEVFQVAKAALLKIGGHPLGLLRLQRSVQAAKKRDEPLKIPKGSRSFLPGIESRLIRLSRFSDHRLIVDPEIMTKPLEYAELKRVLKTCGDFNDVEFGLSTLSGQVFERILPVLKTNFHLQDVLKSNAVLMKIFDGSLIISVEAFSNSVLCEQLEKLLRRSRDFESVRIGTSSFFRENFSHMLPGLKEGTLLPDDLHRTVGLIPLADLDLNEPRFNHLEWGQPRSALGRHSEIREVLRTDPEAWERLYVLTYSLAELKLLWPRLEERLADQFHLFFDGSYEVMEDAFRLVIPDKYRGSFQQDFHRYYRAVAFLYKNISNPVLLDAYKSPPNIDLNENLKMSPLINLWKEVYHDLPTEFREPLERDLKKAFLEFVDTDSKNHFYLSSNRLSYDRFRKSCPEVSACMEQLFSSDELRRMEFSDLMKEIDDSFNTVFDVFLSER